MGPDMSPDVDEHGIQRQPPGCGQHVDREHGRWDVEAERPRSLKVDHRFIIGRRLTGRSARSAPEDVIDISGLPAENYQEEDFEARCCACSIGKLKCCARRGRAAGRRRGGKMPTGFAASVP